MPRIKRDYLEHTREHKQHKPEPTRESPAARGYDRRWRRFREVYLSKFPLCGDCKEHITAAAELHHVVKPRDGGSFYDLDNLIGLCKACHSRRTASGE